MLLSIFCWEPEQIFPVVNFVEGLNFVKSLKEPDKQDKPLIEIYLFAEIFSVLEIFSAFSPHLPPVTLGVCAAYKSFCHVMLSSGPSNQTLS